MAAPGVVVGGGLLSGIDRDMQIAHLHVHSHFSLLEATPAPAALVERAVTEGMTSLALTDSAALYGVVAFRRLCLEAGIQPIIGMSVTVGGALGQPAGLLVLLARNPAGYRSLCRLSSLMQGQPQRLPELSWEALRENRAGLLCLDGGLQGHLAHYLRLGDGAAAEQHVDRLVTIFERCYLTLELHRPEDEALAREIVAVGQRKGIPVVAVQPVYCFSPEEGETIRLLQAINRIRPLEEVAVPEPVRHWLSAAQMAERFSEYPAALECIGEVVAQCGPALPSGQPIWPALKLPRPPDDLLAVQAQAGLARRFPDADTSAHERAIARLRIELEAINRHGFAPLFLVVADIVRFARRAGIPVSTRGSVANSLVAYCLGITIVDPLAHDLLFERFLNPARSSPPDIDLDFCSRRRDEVLDYVRQTYGEEHVALVATVNTLQPKSAVRETAKAFGYDEEAIKRLTRLLPREWHPDPRRRGRRTLADVLEEVEDERDRAVLTAAYRIIGQPHHLSVHPGGVIITPGPLTDVTPVQWAPKGFLITQYDHFDVEAIGLPKLDLLGIRALTVLADALERVKESQQLELSLDDLPAEDELTGRMLQAGETIGVFQCESSGAQRTLRQLRARNVADLAVANAFFKPGPATGGMAQSFIRRYRGQEGVTYLHPLLEPILERTKGVLLFQEQILRVAREIAGLSWDQADHLRRGMSKFRPDEMAAIADKFRAGCRDKGLTAGQAATLWEQVMAFAGYGFNQGHATAYAVVSYQSAYLKAHWPAEFLWARLVNEGGFHHPAIYMAEAVRLGCRVMPPHVNVSERRFTLTREQGQPVLWMGLGQVRDLRDRSVRAIIEGRPFSGVRDLLARVRLQEVEIRHLIQCGALDGLGANRADMLALAREVDQAGSARQMAFSFAAAEATPAESTAERVAWERHILGQPVSVHPLALAPEALRAIKLAALPHSETQLVEVCAVRLPGWTGGEGFFIGDENSYVVARAEGAAPRTWEALKLQGRWRTDAWGSEWFQVQQVQML